MQVSKSFSVFLFFLILGMPSGNAQYCAFDEMHQTLLKTDTFYKKRVEDMERLIYNQSLALQQKKVNPRSKANYILPVVIHLIVPPGTNVGQGNNLTDAQVEQGLDYLNQAFSNSGPFMAANGVDCGIQFCLARRDPNGQPTNGITRTASTLVADPTCNPGTDAGSDGAIKMLDNWDCTRYINIWLVTDLFNTNFGCSLAGYAYFPGAPCSVDGIVQESRYWNSVGGTVVTAHEMGHYFSLNHTFNGGCTNTNCLLDGDRVCDTPPDNSSSFAPCNTNSCTNDLPDLPDDNTNYMDYTSCSPPHFTDGQRIRMTAALESTRKSLIQSNGCLPPGDYDAAALNLSFSNDLCADSLCASLKLRNDGSKKFSSVQINFSLDGVTPSSIIWTGMLNPTESTLIKIPCIKINPGKHELIITIGNPDNQLDFYLSNNSIKLDFETYPNLNLALDSITPTHCISDGTLAANASGGTKPYIYKLDKRSGTQTIPYFQLLLSGSYVLTVVDTHNCQANLQIDIPDSCKVINNKKFITNKDARQLGNDCYLLTEERNYQTGSIWYEDKVSLLQSFDIYFDLNLGCIDANGADGIAFVFQPISTSIGVTGGGLGYQGVIPSLAVEFDTWQNANFSDPFYDHVSLMRNGNVDHAASDNLSGPVGMFPGNANAEDCKFHKALIRWSASNQTIEVYIDCNLRLRYSGDIIRSIFNNDPNVYFGFTAATGGAINVQQICLNYITGINKLPDYTICDGESIQIAASPKFDKYQWSPVTGISNASIQNPIFNPDSTTKYFIHYKDFCGFDYRDSLTVHVKKLKLEYDLRLSDSCGSFSGALLHILEKPEDSAALYSMDGVRFWKQIFYELPYAGFYTIYVKIGNCIIPEIIEVGEYKHKLRDSLLWVQGLNCKDSGRIVITGLEGIPPYQYRINGGSWQNDGGFNGLLPGNYVIDIRDSTSCSVQRTVQIVKFINKLSLKQDSADFEIDCCNPRSFIHVSAGGSFPFYYYSLDQNSWTASGAFDSIPSGPHQLVARDEFGCSSDTLYFNVVDHSQISVDTQTFKLCEGEYVQVGSKRYDQSGSYTDVFKNVFCCDSILVTNLVVNPVYSKQNIQTICSGDFIQVGNKSYSSSGIYLDTLQSISSCDSIIYTQLTVNPSSNNKLNYTICAGESIQVGSHQYTNSGTYIDSLTTVKGCDSIIQTQLQVNPNHQQQFNYLKCKGQFVQIGSNVYTKSGHYIDSLSNQFGCDSLIYTDLLIDTVSALLTVDSILCFGDDNGQIEIKAIQGIREFLFALNDPTTYSKQTVYDQLKPGSYTVFIKDSIGCENSYSILLFQPQKLAADLPVEIKLTLGDKITLKPLLNFNPVKIEWTPSNGLSCTDCLEPNLQALHDAVYEVRFTDSYGCEVVSQVKILVNNQTDIYIPNVFTPNGDQINDWITVFGGESIQEVKLFQLFDRWGNLVFENQHFQVNDLAAGWNGLMNGQHMNPAVFVYHAIALRLDGTEIQKTGTITLIR